MFVVLLFALQSLLGVFHMKKRAIDLKRSMLFKSIINTNTLTYQQG